MLSPRGTSEYNRYKYYSALKTGYKHLGNKVEFLDIPKHVIAEENPYLVNMSFSCKLT
jgi:hypothetical protein